MARGRKRPPSRRLWFQFVLQRAIELAAGEEVSEHQRALGVVLGEDGHDGDGLGAQGFQQGHEFRVVAGQVHAHEHGIKLRGDPGAVFGAEDRFFQEFAVGAPVGREIEDDVLLAQQGLEAAACRRPG